MNILIVVGSVYLGSIRSYFLKKKKITKDLSWMVANRNKLMIGREEEIIITKKHKSSFGGRTRNFKEVFIPESDDIVIGQKVLVKITELDGWVLKGELVK